MSDRHGRAFAWVLNLDAELELERPDYAPSAKLSRALSAHRARARSLFGPRDFELGERSLSPGIIGRAWCPTPKVRSLLERAGATVEPAPTPDVLRRVNHRAFAAELGAGPKGARYVRTRDELEQLLVNEAHRDWIFKRPFGFAGRGQLRVAQPLSDYVWRWVLASLRQDGFMAEPLVAIETEVALHGWIAEDRTLSLGRPCLQTIGPGGVWAATRLARTHELDQFELHELFGAGTRVAHALREAGYFGPFNIDGYRYRDHVGCAQFIALSEINARFTMGFAIGMAEHAALWRGS